MDSLVDVFDVGRTLGFHRPCPLQPEPGVETLPPGKGGYLRQQGGGGASTVVPAPEQGGYTERAPTGRVQVGKKRRSGEAVTFRRPTDEDQRS